jgi:L-lactate dehydrogenase complex protein LldG
VTSKLDIIRSISGQLLQAVELPALDGFGIVYDDPLAQFERMLDAVGGRAIRVADKEALNRELQQLEFIPAARRIHSRVDSGIESTVDLAAVADPHELDDLDVAIMHGEFAVAENAAVWVTDHGTRHRVVYFIAQHLVLVVDARSIVHNMHQAYQRLKFDEPGYGVFISGPSKTADIEQSLVIGAQGPRSLHVFFLGETPA